MSIRQTIAHGRSGAHGESESPANSEPTVPEEETCLVRLVEGTALNMPKIDAETYKEFRSNVRRLSLQILYRQPDADKMALIRTIIHEFENYHSGCENALRDRVTGWQAVAAKLTTELFASYGISATSAHTAPLIERIESLDTAADLQAWRCLLDEFLQSREARRRARESHTSLDTPDHSTANDNAAGLPGGGKAIQHLEKIMARGSDGFIVVFRFSCLEVIAQRFGLAAVQDCLMAVSAFLTSSLHNDDAIYHWSDSSLLAILEARPNERILTAELQRIVTQNRDITIKMGERTVMVRVPMTFELTPIANLQTAGDLNNLPGNSSNTW